MAVLGFDGLHPFCKVNVTDRASIQELLKKVLDPLLPYFSPGRARVRCPGSTAVRFDQAAIDFEGYARPLWGLASLIAGGGHYEHTELWIEGLKNGTNPDHPEFWGWPTDNDQRMVEMCCLGFTLAAAPEFWHKLSDSERSNVEQWLGNSINSKTMPNTNWLWFRQVANTGLKLNGAKHSQQRMDQDIDHLDSFYRGDGWSNDGPEGIHQMDYYSSSFAIQFLQLLYVKLQGKEDEVRAAEFKKRAQHFALDVAHYFDDTGRCIPFGRSMTYRWGVVSFWGALAYAGVDLPAPLTWGMVKGIVMRHFRYWQTEKDVWTEAGTMSLGYTYPCMYMTENYNSPGSPYWSCLGFICLAVPPDHPFWTSTEESHLSTLSSVVTINQPKHIVSHRGGHHMLLSSGQAAGYAMKAAHAKYGAFEYSSFFGFSVPSGGYTLEQYALASQLGFSDDGGETWKTRRLCEYAGLEEINGQPALFSIWKPYPDVEVRTTLLPPAEATPNWSLRVHQITSGRTVMTADGSFAIQNVNAKNGRFLELYDDRTHEGTRPKILGNYDTDVDDGWAAGADGAFAVSHGAVGIKALEPAARRRAMLVNADPNTNLCASKTLIPTLQQTIQAGETVWYVSAIYAVASGPKEELLKGWDSPPPCPLELLK